MHGVVLPRRNEAAQAVDEEEQRDGAVEAVAASPGERCALLGPVRGLVLMLRGLQVVKRNVKERETSKGGERRKA